MFDQTAFNQIAETLAGHYDSVFYVDAESGHYTVLVPTQMLTDLNIPEEGEDFFAMVKANADKYVHPDDLNLALFIHDKQNIVESVSKNGSYSVTCRLIIDGNIIHIRHVDMLCKDGKHILFCMENINDETREKEAQLERLQSVERQVKLDELTGIRNYHAFVELGRSLDESIRKVDTGLKFGIIVCDVNDLKLYNDTRGHSFGDEYLRRACRMICENFTRSQIFRIGGDEFAVFYMGKTEEEVKEDIEKMRKALSETPYVCAFGYEMVLDKDISAAMIQADAEMYANKAKIKNNNERKIAAHREATISVLHEALGSGMWGMEFDEDGNMVSVEWSPEFRKMIGYTDENDFPNELESWSDLLHPDDKAAVLKDFNETINDYSGKKNYDVEYRLKVKSGEWRWFHALGRLLRRDNGVPLAYVGMFVDINAKKTGRI